MNDEKRRKIANGNGTNGKGTYMDGERTAVHKVGPILRSSVWRLFKSISAHFRFSHSAHVIFPVWFLVGKLTNKTGS